MNSTATPWFTQRRRQVVFGPLRHGPSQPLTRGRDLHGRVEGGRRHLGVRVKHNKAWEVLKKIRMAKTWQEYMMLHDFICLYIYHILPRKVGFCTFNMEIITTHTGWLMCVNIEVGHLN